MFAMIRLTEMLRIFCLLAAVAAWGQQGRPDPVFDKVPFDEWLKGEGESRIRWTLHIAPPRLTPHQRLSASISVEIDGNEFVKRKPAKLVVFLEVRDEANRVYRTHSAMDFDLLKAPRELATAGMDQTAFFVPGDYRVAVAVYDVQSKEHAAKQVKLHIADLPKDPLPEMWRDLPPVEFVGSKDAPERWFLPEISSRLRLQVRTARPVRVDVLVNESPTERAVQSAGRVTRRNMGNLIPALKVLTQMEIQLGTVNVALLDLERRKVSFEQDNAGTLDWVRLKDALRENDPNTINVKALEHHEQNAQFFISEVRKRLEANRDGALIVLSGPMAFPKGQDLRPIEAAPGTKVFYVRYFPPMGFPMGFVGHGGSNVGPPAPIPGRGHSMEDSLAGTLKPLSPRRFDVSTPAEFRAALAAIMSELSQLK